ncbi:hypothetical protein FACS1894127_1740 [Clostridia bacterium]|nr:hypothetical protein FACS1894127_1740 [Clostridia bacterium]
MTSRIIIRTTSGISFIGIKSNEIVVDGDGFLIQTNPEMNLKIWVPYEEVESIIDKNVVYSAKEYNEFTLYRRDK